MRKRPQETEHLKEDSVDMDKMTGHEKVEKAFTAGEGLAKKLQIGL